MSLDLEAIKARADAATQGPWTVKMDAVWAHEPDPRAIPPIVADRGDGHPDLVGADLTFIAHAREDVPALLAEVERLRAAEATGYTDLAAAFRGIVSRCDHDPKLQRAYEMAARVVEEHMQKRAGVS